MSWITVLTLSINPIAKYISQNDGGIGKNGSGHLKYIIQKLQFYLSMWTEEKKENLILWVVISYWIKRGC